MSQTQRIAYGSSFASFGELVQGRRSDGEDFLVTLPVDMWTTCRLVCEPVAGASVVETELAKSRRVAEYLLAFLGLQAGVKIGLEFARGIPIGKGLSSSTADMLAVVRAFSQAFGLVISEDFIARMFAEIEPHDGLQYGTSVVYNHRQGKLLHKFDLIPSYAIVAVDSGGEVCTVEYNKNLDFSTAFLSEYDRLYGELVQAFAQRDFRGIAQCARRSAELHVQRTGNTFLAAVLDKAARLDVLGVLATHSGTCGGLLLPGDASGSLLDRVEAEISAIGRVFRTRTLQRL